MRGTTYQFAHHRTVDGVRCLIWGNGIGEVLVPTDSPEYHEALMDRCWNHNALANEGEQAILETYFRSTAKASNLYGRLYNATPTETSTLATIGTETSGTGYGAVTFAVGNTDFPTSALTGGGGTDWKVTSAVKTFTAGGTWTAATNLVLASVASGTAGLHIAWSPLSATRTLANTDTLDVSIAIELA